MKKILCSLLFVNLFFVVFSVQAASQAASDRAGKAEMKKPPAAVTQSIGIGKMVINGDEEETPQEGEPCAINLSDGAAHCEAAAANMGYTNCSCYMSGCDVGKTDSQGNCKVEGCTCNCTCQ